MYLNCESVCETVEEIATVAMLPIYKIAHDVANIPQIIRGAKSWSEAAGRVTVIAADCAGIGIAVMNPSLVNAISFGIGFTFGADLVAGLCREEKAITLIKLSDPSPHKILLTGAAVFSLFVQKITPVTFISGMFAYSRCIDTR